MIIRDIDKYKSIYDKVDALIIVNEENMILYSAMINDDRTYISTKDVIGQNLYEMYPNLTEENSTHARGDEDGKTCYKRESAYRREKRQGLCDQHQHFSYRR